MRVTPQLYKLSGQPKKPIVEVTLMGAKTQIMIIAGTEQENEVDEFNE